MKYSAVNMIINSTNNLTASFVPLSILSPSKFIQTSIIFYKINEYLYKYIMFFELYIFWYT